MRIAYFYLMVDGAARVRGVAPRHTEYWRGKSLPGYAGGPFADRSGGLITFDVGSLDEAGALVNADPFVLEGVLQAMWLKEWRLE